MACQSLMNVLVLVGAAEGCDLLILIFSVLEGAKDQKIAAFGSSYGDFTTQINCGSELARDGGGSITTESSDRRPP